LLVMELNADKTFKSVKPKIVKLTSFQATSLRVTPQRIYITTGDGTGGTKGGLYILSASDYSLVKFVEGKENARSVAVEGSNVFLMQAMSAKVTKFDVTGGNEDAIYPKVYDVDLEGNENNYTYENEAMQEAARSDMIAWNNLLFVSMNESGLRMLKNDGTVGQTIERPGPDKDKHVTNSVSMNTDKKKDANGKEVQSNLLLLANGEKGIYWYDVVKDTYGNDRIVASAANSVLAAAGKSANFISSKGNVVFVANGLGGLKVLYIGFEEAPVKETCPPGGVFKHQTFIKDNGNSKFPPPALPLDRKVGEVLIQDEGDYLVIYLWPTVPNLKLNNAGIFFGPNLEWLDAYKDGNQGVFLGSGAPKDKNVGNGFMKDRNKDYRTIYSDGSVRFAFPKDFVKDFIDPVTGELLIIVYSGNGAWGYGIPNGPSGVTGTGVNNNGQIIVLKGVGFCK